MKPIVLIPARMASTRLPGKPLADIAGTPMIVRVWQQAMAAAIGPVVVAAAEREIVAAVETILNENRLLYSTVNSSQLNKMAESQMRGYRLLIVPGGNFIDIGKSLTSSATANIRSAVQNGLNCICLPG